jgi:hypothetical protein
MFSLPDYMKKTLRIQQEELRIWRAKHPREADAVREEAASKIEGREPNYAPGEAFGAPSHGR